MNIGDCQRGNLMQLTPASVKYRRSVLSRNDFISFASVGVILGLVTALLSTNPGRALGLLVLVGVPAVGFIAAAWARPRMDSVLFWWPVVLPTFLWAFSAVVVLRRDEAIGLLRPSDLTPELLGMCVAYVAAYVLSASVVARRASKASRPHFGSSRDAQASVALHISLILVAALVALRVVDAATRGFSSAGRGVNQIGGIDDLSIATLINVFLPGLFAVMGLLLRGHARGSRFVTAIALLGIFSLVTISGGARATPLAALGSFLVAYWGPQFRMRLKTAAAIFAVAGLAIVVGDLRGGQQGLGTIDPASGLVRAGSSPLFIAADLERRIPAQSGFWQGETIIGAVIRLPPSNVTRSYFERPHTGAIAYRELRQFTNPDAGLGFSVLAEGYGNWGYAGIVFFGALYGLVLTRLWVGWRSNSFSSSVAFSVAIGNYQYWLRTDLLGAGKSLIYGWLVGIVVFWLAGMLASRYVGFNRRRVGIWTP